MKKVNLLLLFFFCIGMTVQVTGQSTTAKKRSLSLTPAIAPAPVEALSTGMEILEGEVSDFDYLEYYNSLNLPEDEVGKEIWMGFTYYDLQTNGVNKHRVHTNSTAGVDRTSMTWTHHKITSDAAFPLRGTGYNYIGHSSSALGLNSSQTSNRIEDRRVGWGNMLVMNDGTEVVISHGPNADVALLNDIVIATKASGSTEWSNTVLPTNTGSANGLLWPQADTDGETIHLVAITTPIGNDGLSYQEMNGALLYYRSKDNGVTWDKQDFLLPGVNAENFPQYVLGTGSITSFGGDSYSLDVEGDNIVIAHFPDIMRDVTVWRSTDGGDNWDEPRKALDCPLPASYKIDDLYSLEDIGGADPRGPAGDGQGGIWPIDSLVAFGSDSTAYFAVLQADGSGYATIEADGTVHLAMGHMYYADDTADGGSRSFWPATNGLMYWNSNLADNELIYIDVTNESMDQNGNNTIDIDANATGSLPRYGGNCLTSMPTIQVTSGGAIIIGYSQKMENYVRAGIDGNPNYPDDQHYQHLFLTGVNKDWVTDQTKWQTPYNIINGDVLFVGGSVVPTTEAAFPHLERDPNSDCIRMSYQTDEEPGLFVYNPTDGSGDQDLMTQNIMSYWNFCVEDVFPDMYLGVGTKAVNTDFFKLEMTPNPASYSVNLQYDLPSSAQSSITVSTVVGQQVMNVRNGLQSAGNYNVDLDISDLATGVYIVSFRSADKVASKKLIVQ